MPLKVDVTALLYMVIILVRCCKSTVAKITLTYFVVREDSLSWAHTAALFLPLPTWIPGIATLMSLIPTLTLIATRFLSLTSNHETPRKNIWSTTCSIINQIQTVISTIMATLALAYLFPDRILSCNLDQQWQGFFQSKNSHAIRSIQDELQCCGLKSLHDRAWPFKDQSHGDNACELQLGYQKSCFASWREQQQNKSWMIFAAIIFGFAAKMALAHLSGQRGSWLSTQSCSRPPGYRQISHLEVPSEESDENNEEAGRTFLPDANIPTQNQWDVA
ncbi:uncharacterized protein N7473_013184 [Penicillium subrubescens]|uniref:uncharacterized protein n=1 Tax=Penicillium subrubescens TaxID=1316194 RepID=UPI0025453932|nr:uncharacterized protein N7473_013184 [Penicillium subrubescens]KAJ5873625.1 hypothetical protein N7473_013184 [Penicillium subrubescens]